MAVVYYRCGYSPSNYHSEKVSGTNCVSVVLILVARIQPVSTNTDTCITNEQQLAAESASTVATVIVMVPPR